MEKEEKKKDIKFSPADYDYMDNMPLEGWMWEFIRRNPVYRNLFSDLAEHDNNVIKIVGEVNDPNSIVLMERKVFFTIKEIREECNILPVSGTEEELHPHDFQLITFTVNNELKTFWGFPNPHIKYNHFDTFTPIIRGASPLISYKVEEQKLKQNGANYCFKIITNILPPITVEDTIYIGISLSAKKEDILQKLQHIIEKNVTSKDIKVRTDKWKYYLITFDLYTVKEKYTEISDILSIAYPENERLFDEKNIENYYKSALELITGGYKKYLYLKPPGEFHVEEIYADESEIDI